MHRLLVFALLCAVVSAAAAAAASTKQEGDDRYTPRFDSIDTDQILSSPRLVKNYVQCLLGRKGCPPEGAELKRVLPDALATRCAKCSQRQRETALHVVKVLRQRYPDMWAELQQKWDPTGEHVRRLEEAEARQAASGAATGTNPATGKSLPIAS